MAGSQGTKRGIMDPTVLINQRIEVVSIFKRNNGSSRLCVPYMMRYRGQDILFTELGLRHPTTGGQRMIHVFDVSDGNNDYRLEFDAESLTWTLVSMIGLAI